MNPSSTWPINSMLRPHRLPKPLKLRLARRLHSTPLLRRPPQPNSNENAEEEGLERYDPTTVDRPTDYVDVCIVGGGPAGLSAAIRLKQLERERGREVRVVVLEKGAEVGSHIVSGAVLEPRALNELLPDWSTHPSHPLTQPATSSRMLFLTPSYSLPIPHPPQMDNTGNYILSLSRFTSWLGQIAEEMGVEVYPGFAGADLVWGRNNDGKRTVRGVITNDVGISRQGYKKPTFEPGMRFLSRITLLAEGAHGSLTKSLIRRLNLRKGKEPQTYGMGVKEVWRVDPSQYRPGEVVHTMGFPLDWRTYGGGWVYHMDGGHVSLGLVIGADWKNPWLSPYYELQRLKHHPYFSTLLSGSSTRLAYAGRTLTEGGLQSLPTLHFPGGALIGCSAGLVNVPKIKGTHNAMKSGMLAAETAYEQLEGRFKSLEEQPEWEDEGEGEVVGDMRAYEEALKDSWVYKELHEVRNLRPSFNTPLGIWGGILYSGIDSFLLKGRVPWTFKHGHEGGDAGATQKAGEVGKRIEYPPPQPPLSTDLLTALALTGTNHAEDQPAHLRVRKYGAATQRASASDSDPEESAEKRIEDEETVDESPSLRRHHVHLNVRDYAGLLSRACPAGVYEYVDAEEGGEKEGEGEGWGGKRLVINAQNCIHCKLCDIKVPTQDITWTVPEGGGGPKYTIT